MTRYWAIIPLLCPVFIILFSPQGSAQECSVDGDCQPAINGSLCIEGNCTCPETAFVLVSVPEQNTSYCLAAFNVTGGNCTIHRQCRYENGRCSNLGTCGCKPKFREAEGKCARNEKTAVIPTAVGIAIGVSVFATLCLYLWLSRKKDKDERRA